jgi:hypothetical protein
MLRKTIDGDGRMKPLANVTKRPSTEANIVG